MPLLFHVLLSPYISLSQGADKNSELLDKYEVVSLILGTKTKQTNKQKIKKKTTKTKRFIKIRTVNSSQPYPLVMMMKSVREVTYSSFCRINRIYPRALAPYIKLKTL